MTRRETSFDRSLAFLVLHHFPEGLSNDFEGKISEFRMDSFGEKLLRSEVRELIAKHMMSSMGNFELQYLMESSETIGNVSEINRRFETIHFLEGQFDYQSFGVMAQR
jgi:hypothetical protein